MAPLILLAAWLLVFGYTFVYHGIGHFNQKPVSFWYALTGQGSPT